GSATRGVVTEVNVNLKWAFPLSRCIRAGHLELAYRWKLMRSRSLLNRRSKLLRIVGWLTVIWSMCNGFAAVRDRNLPPLSPGAWVETKPMLEFCYGGDDLPAGATQFHNDLTA